MKDNGEDFNKYYAYEAEHGKYLLNGASPWPVLAAIGFAFVLAVFLIMVGLT